MLLISSKKKLLNLLLVGLRSLEQYSLLFVCCRLQELFLISFDFFSIHYYLLSSLPYFGYTFGYYYYHSFLYCVSRRAANTRHRTTHQSKVISFI